MCVFDTALRSDPRDEEEKKQMSLAMQPRDRWLYPPKLRGERSVAIGKGAYSSDAGEQPGVGHGDIQLASLQNHTRRPRIEMARSRSTSNKKGIYTQSLCALLFLSHSSLPPSLTLSLTLSLSRIRLYDTAWWVVSRRGAASRSREACAAGNVCRQVDLGIVRFPKHEHGLLTLPIQLLKQDEGFLVQS